MTTFPSSPTVGDTFAIDTVTYQWDGVAWTVLSVNPVMSPQQSGTTADFPDNPAIGQEFSFQGTIWVWDGTAWTLRQAAGTSFLALTDTPANYSGQAGKFVRVAQDEAQLIFDTVDSLYPPLDGRYLKLTGGTLTGPLTLSGAPTANLQAATKKYVDDADALLASSIADTNDQFANYLPLTGGTLTGPLFIEHQADQDALIIKEVTGVAGAHKTLEIARASGEPIFRILADMYADAQKGTITLDHFISDAVIGGGIQLQATDVVLSGAAPANVNALSSASIMSRARGDARYLQLAGGTITGAVTMAAAAINQLIFRGRPQDSITDIEFRNNAGDAAFRWSIRAQPTTTGGLQFRHNDVSLAQIASTGSLTLSGTAGTLITGTGGVVSNGEIQHRAAGNNSIGFRAAAGALRALIYTNIAQGTPERAAPVLINYYDEAGANPRVAAIFPDRIVNGGTLDSSQSVVTREHGDARYAQPFQTILQNQTTFTGDLNTLIGPNASTSYFCITGATNRPAEVNGTLLVQTHPSNDLFCTQIYIEATGGSARTWVRGRANGNWGAWVETSGGGSVEVVHDPANEASYRLDRSTNTLECWGFSTSGTVTFPVGFVRAPEVSVSTRRASVPAADGVVSWITSITPTGFVSTGRQFNAGIVVNSPGSVEWYAIGEWDGVDP